MNVESFPRLQGVNQTVEWAETERDAVLLQLSRLPKHLLSEGLQVIHKTQPEALIYDPKHDLIGVDRASLTFFVVMKLRAYLNTLQGKGKIEWKSDPPGNSADSKALEVLTGIIDLPISVVSQVKTEEMAEDLDSMVPLWDDQKDNSEIAEEESEYSYDHPTMDETDSVRKPKRKKFKRQSTNIRTREELHAEGFFEYYVESGIQIYRSIDRNEVKRLLCFDCGKRFRGKTEIMVHVRTHTGEKPLQCSYCDRKFAHPSNLRVHERLHCQKK